MLFLVPFCCWTVLTVHIFRFVSLRKKKANIFCTGWGRVGGFILSLLHFVVVVVVVCCCCCFTKHWDEKRVFTRFLCVSFLWIFCLFQSPNITNHFYLHIFFIENFADAVNKLYPNLSFSYSDKSNSSSCQCKKDTSLYFTDSNTNCVYIVTVPEASGRDSIIGPVVGSVVGVGVPLTVAMIVVAVVIWWDSCKYLHHCSL